MPGGSDRPAGTVVAARPIPGLPEVTVGADLAALILHALDAAGLELEARSVLVVSSKVISKALGLWDGRPREEVIAGATHKVVAERMVAGAATRIVESIAGPVMAAAGVDASNTGGRDELLVLPSDADLEAASLRRNVIRGLGRADDWPLAVIVSDTAGRPWRSGQTDFALGSAGIQPMLDHRGALDHDGRPLAVTARCIVDELAALADLVKGKSDGVPAALVTGCPAAWFDPVAPGARSVVRTGPEDWFGLGSQEAVRHALGISPGSVAAATVGVRSAGPEAPVDVIARALRVALYEQPDIVGEVDDAGSVRLRASDDRALGRAQARLEVALRGEGVDVDAVTVDALIDPEVDPS